MKQTSLPPLRFRTSGAPPQVFSIQYLRGFAAASVLVTHALQWPLGEINLTLLKTGRMGVEVFFVISGFIITMIAGDGRFNPGGFLTRRAFRIVPAYWAATILVTVLALALPNQFRTTIPTIEGVLKSLAFIPSHDPKAPLLMLGWTLNYEVFFYVVFASLFFLKSTMRTLVLCGFFAVLVGIGQVADQPSYLQAFYLSPSLIGFCLGTVVAQAFRHGLLDRITRGGDIVLAVGAVVLMALYYVIPWGDVDSDPIPQHVLMSVAAVSVVVMGMRIEIAGRLPNLAALKYLGDTSYSVYLFHIFAVAAIWAVAKHVFDLQQHFAIYLACAAVAIVAGTVFGLICHHLVERPFLNASRKWRRTAVPA